MLTQIHIKHFAIIEEIDLVLEKNMTVITGETGAGKSIILDALAVALGARTSPEMIRHGEKHCEITLTFRLDTQEALLCSYPPTSEGSYLIRRIISADGRSRQYINHSAVTLARLKEITGNLLHIHGQNQHQLLMKSGNQREWVDAYGHHTSALERVKSLAAEWLTIQKQLDAYRHQDPHQAETELMIYQIAELEEAQLLPNECTDLHEEYKKLANASTLLNESQWVLSCMGDDSDQSLSRSLHHMLSKIQPLQQFAPELDNIAALLNNSLIQINEAETDMRHFVENLQLDPTRLMEVDNRLQSLHQLARKHKVAPEDLLTHLGTLRQHIQNREHQRAERERLGKEASRCLEAYQLAAMALYEHRLRAGTELARKITDNMRHLGMEKGQFDIRITHDSTQMPSPHGQDKISFYVSTNLGQPLQPLEKVASGGELSRLSLAIQVITAQALATPCLIFDEVDVGIGGDTALMVAQLLRELAQYTQVICITHLAQIAVQGHQHFFLYKIMDEGVTRSEVKPLNETERIHEISRMLGGDSTNPHGLAHAKAMLDCVMAE